MPADRQQHPLQGQLKTVFELFDGGKSGKVACHAIKRYFSSHFRRVLCSFIVLRSLLAISEQLEEPSIYKIVLKLDDWP